MTRSSRNASYSQGERHVPRRREATQGVYSLVVEIDPVGQAIRGATVLQLSGKQNLVESRCQRGGLQLGAKAINPGQVLHVGQESLDVDRDQHVPDVVVAGIAVRRQTEGGAGEDT